MPTTQAMAPQADAVKLIEEMGLERRSMPVGSETIRWGDPNLSMGIVWHAGSALPWGAYWTDPLTRKIHLVFASNVEAPLALLVMAAQL